MSEPILWAHEHDKDEPIAKATPNGDGSFTVEPSWTEIVRRLNEKHIPQTKWQQWKARPLNEFRWVLAKPARIILQIVFGKYYIDFFD